MSRVTQSINLVSEDNGSSTPLGSGQSVQRLPVELGRPRAFSRTAKQPKGSSLRASAPPFVVSTELKQSMARISQSTKRVALSEPDTKHEQGTPPELVGNAFAPWYPYLKPLLFDQPSFDISFVPEGGFELTTRIERSPSDGVKFEACESELGEGNSDAIVISNIRLLTDL